MRIINPRVQKDIENNRPIRLNLGSGNNRREGFYSVDILELDDLDILANLNEPFDLLPDNCADRIYSRHAFEHVENLLLLVSEIYRIATPNAHVEIVVPHFSNPYYYSDPTHARFFGLYSMYYFAHPDRQPNLRKVPVHYTEARFHVELVQFEFYRIGLMDKIVTPFLSRIINSSFALQDFYERRLSRLFHAWQLRYILKPDK